MITNTTETLVQAAQFAGKTTALLILMSYDATGHYPKEFTGHRFDKPIKFALGGATGATTRDLMTDRLVGPKGARGHGMLPFECIEEDLISYMSGGVKDQVDKIKVRWMGPDNKWDGKSYSIGYVFSYASGCGVYELTGWDYSDELLSAADLPREMFPKPVPSTEILGELLPEVAQQLGLPKTVKVACGGVDNSCMALGARNIAEGRTYTSLGSSTWIAVSSNRPLLDINSKPYVFTHVMPDMFTSAIGIFSTGTSFKWVRDQLCANLLVEAEREGKDPYDAMTALAQTSPAGANRLLFNPSLAGGSSLEPSLHIRGALLGMDLGHTQADVIRAVMEGIAMNMRVALDEMRSLSPVSSGMVAVGGGTKSDFWLQIMANACNIRIARTNIGQQAGSLGAAALAAVGAGLWKDFNRIDEIHQVQYTATPQDKHVPG